MYDNDDLIRAEDLSTSLRAAERRLELELDYEERLIECGQFVVAIKDELDLLDEHCSRHGLSAMESRGELFLQLAAWIADETAADHDEMYPSKDAFYDHAFEVIHRVVPTTQSSRGSP